jgi:hypothetical protein
MRFSLSFALLALAGLGLGSCSPTPRAPALAQDAVNHLVYDCYVALLTKYNNATATKCLSPSFTDTSDSINILAGIPLGNVTFPTLAAFEQHELTDVSGFSTAKQSENYEVLTREQPDDLPVKVSSIGPVSGNQITLIWTATFGAAQKTVRGITIIGATFNNGCWQIATLTEEFNSIAFLQDIGGSCTFPPAPSA